MQTLLQRVGPVGSLRAYRECCRVALTMFFYSDKNMLGQESEKKEEVFAHAHRTAALLSLRVSPIGRIGGSHEADPNWTALSDTHSDTRALHDCGQALRAL